MTTTMPPHDPNPAPHAFTGSVPPIYDRHLGPVIFVPWADDLAARFRPGPRARVLEVACGTGIVTERLLARLPTGGRLVATDLNPAMLDVARTRVGADARLEFRTADAQRLPFGDAAFDHYICQFGVMFFPDKVGALREARRVLAPGGEVLLNTWGPMHENDFARIGHATIATFFAEDPPAFYLTPFGWHDEATIRAEFTAAGFANVAIEPAKCTIQAASAADFAIGVVCGNPIAVAITERLGNVHDKVVAAVAAELAKVGGAAPWRSTVTTRVVRATR
jgi:ubiquinone/menaquinone biosynthesis C-methylase UbiE